jgi:hypothetical protein
MQRRSGPCRGIARGAAQLLPGLSTAEAGYAGGPTTGAAPSCVRFACRVRLPRWWRPWRSSRLQPRSDERRPVESAPERADGHRGNPLGELKWCWPGVEYDSMEEALAEAVSQPSACM